MYKDFLKQGKIKEKEFADLFKKIKFASPEQDITEHWDIEIGLKIDVKGLHKDSRSDNEFNENIHWVELLNVNGKIGWLYSEYTDYFAFETTDYWVIVEKIKLQNMIKEKVSKEYVEYSNDALYKLYRRSGRKDTITKVKTMDLIFISDTMIKK